MRRASVFGPLLLRNNTLRWLDVFGMLDPVIWFTYVLTVCTKTIEAPVIRSTLSKRCVM